MQFHFSVIVLSKENRNANEVICTLTIVLYFTVPVLCSDFGVPHLSAIGVHMINSILSLILETVQTISSL